MVAAMIIYNWSRFYEIDDTSSEVTEFEAVRYRPFESKPDWRAAFLINAPESEKLGTKGNFYLGEDDEEISPPETEIYRDYSYMGM
tara:strand:+ start:460 stop:717 length:258 start_codon:yes stop_codon:yes gene_type:complete